MRSVTTVAYRPALSRREVLRRGGVVLGGLALAPELVAETSQVLEVAYAGSMGSLMEGSVKSAARSCLGLEIHGRGQGASALAQLIAGGSIAPDVFLPITASPMRTVFQAGKADMALPIARTEMVIAYSPKSRFAAKFAAAANGHGQWWQVLQEPGLRFGRTDPAADPQGRNIIFTMMLASKLYGQPNLVANILGPTINPKQINMEASVQARLQSGDLDAASAYRIQPDSFHLPFLTLPAEINLSGERVSLDHPEIQLSVGGRTYLPEPLIFYAAILKGARNASGATRFVQWLRGPEAQALLRQLHYDSVADAATLHA